MTIHEMENEIEVTRHELEQTLQALQTRLSPSRRIKAALGATRSGGRDALRNAFTWALAHPGQVLAIGAAVVLAVSLRPDGGSRDSR